MKEEYYVWLLNSIKATNAYYESNGEAAPLNRTEKMLLNVVCFKEAAGKKVISTQIADYLNVTRSAVSQTVNKLEREGYVCRVPSDTDKKIFYVCLSEREKLKFEARVKREREFFDSIAEEMGEEQMRELTALGDKFFRIMQGKRENGKKI